VELVYVDGNDLRAAELAAIAPSLHFTIAALQSGFSTSAPEPGQRARDKVLAHPIAGDCFAEAVDLTTIDGKSLRLELDSENENRFCKWWRETPVTMQLAIAMRRGGEVQLFSAACTGCIANKPAGPLILGWDRLFVPSADAGDETLAQLIAAGELVEFRREAFAQLVRALA
jgi:hypothetical protein